MKEATAEVSLDIWVHCPECTEFQEVTDRLREDLGDDLRATDLETEIKCSNPECEELFIVTECSY